MPSLLISSSSLPPSPHSVSLFLLRSTALIAFSSSFFFSSAILILSIASSSVKLSPTAVKRRLDSFPTAGCVGVCFCIKLAKNSLRGMSDDVESTELAEDWRWHLGVGEI